MEQNSTPKKLHNVILEDRKKLSISGMTDVDCFDDHAIRLYTNMGELTVGGKNLHINSMSVETGDILIEGEIHTIFYGDENAKGPISFLGKLFK